jgi:hypothetical protein
MVQSKFSKYKRLEVGIDHLSQDWWTSWAADYQVIPAID